MLEDDDCPKGLTSCPESKQVLGFNSRGDRTLLQAIITYPLISLIRLKFIFFNKYFSTRMHIARLFQVVVAI